MNRTLKVFFACAFSAGIGTMIALQIGGYLWWIGMVIGGLIGYLSYEFKAVISAIVFAWKEVLNIQPNWPEIKNACKQVFWALMFLAGIGSSMYATCSFVSRGIEGSEVAILLALIGFAASVFFVIGQIEAEQGQLFPPYLNPYWFKMAILFTSPIFFFIVWPIVVLYYFALWIILFFREIPKLIPKIAKGAISLSKLVASFFKTVFVQIHSDERLLCFLDAGIGAGIGYYYHYALIGAIAGGILGVANYELISKRWLKLVPTKS